MLNYTFFVQTCRLWNLSIASVLALTLSNVLLTVRLLHSTDCPFISVEDTSAASFVAKAPPLTPPTCLEYVILDNSSNRTDRPVFSDLDLQLGRWDSRRLYKIFEFVVIGDRFAEITEQYKVCLATQSSIERLGPLVQVAHHWTGPISVAIFAAGNDELYLLQIYLTFLRKCYPDIRERVSFHLAYPRDKAPTQIKQLSLIDRMPYDCAKPEATLAKLIQMRTHDTIKWRSKNIYPQNHLRNVARKTCQSDNVFLTDIDIIPSINMTEYLDKFLRHTKCPNNQCAYVIPTYELDYRARFPRDKPDLIRLARKGLARPFHHKVFIYNQYATNFTR